MKYVSSSKNITELLLEGLKTDIKYWNNIAISANQTNDSERCRKALQEQGKAIRGLIKMAETYTIMK
jgi:hypothetical protein